MSTGEYILNFFTKFIGTPAILIGLFAFVGCLLQKKKFTETITSTFKTTIGFLIIGGGATIISGSVGKLGNAFNLLFNRSGAMANNDIMPSLLMNVSNIVLTGSLIMICAMILNIILARITQFKYIYLTGHVLFYLSVMFASVLHMAGLNLDNGKNIATVVVSGALLVSIYMVLTPALLNKHVVKITNNDTLAIGHTGAIGYWLSAMIGSLITKMSKKSIKSTEEVEFPKGLSFLRNTNVAIGLTMLIVYMIIYFTTWGVRGYDAMISKEIIAKGDDVFVQGLLQAFTFAAGVEVVLIGVRMFIAEIVPSFQGISQKVVPNAKAALDCPTVFPYAPNAVLIGFISSFVGGIIAMTITISIVSATGINASIWLVVIPSIVPHFFVGATCGVFGNSTGGIKGAIAGAFINGLIISFVPFLFFGLQMMPKIEGNMMAWGDGDFLLGLPFALIMKVVGQNLAVWLLPVISIIFWSILPMMNLIQTLKNKGKQTIKIEIKAKESKNETNITQKIEIKNINLTQKNKLVAVCGQGLGSSLMIEMNLKKIIEELDLPIEVTHTNLNSFNAADDSILAVVCGVDLADSINFEKKIILSNLLDLKEAKQKIEEFLN